MNHTPGPWRVAPASAYAGADINVDAGTNGFVALCGTRGDAVAEANAKLIAAAPELFEALYRLLCNCPTGPEYDDEGLYQAAMERAREAILKVGAA